MTPTQTVATNERQSAILPNGNKIIDSAIARQLALDLEECGKALNAMSLRCERLLDERAEAYETINTLHNLCLSAEKRALKKRDEEIAQIKNELQYLVEVCETNLETKDWPRFKYAKRIAAGSNDKLTHAE